MHYHSLPSELFLNNCKTLRETAISEFKVSSDTVALRLPDGENVQYKIKRADVNTIYCEDGIEVWINPLGKMLDVGRVIKKRKFSFLFKTIQGVEISIITNPRNIQL